MNKIKNKYLPGFTIVELLIVIVVIGILAAIVVVAYNGIQSRAAESSAEAAVTQIAKEIKIHQITNGGYPDDLAEIGVQSEGGVTYDYAAVADGFCLSAEVKGVVRSINQLESISPGSCELSLVKWSVSGSGISIDSATSQVHLDPNQTGNILSPFIHSDGASSVRIRVQAYATQPSPNRTPKASSYFGSLYYGADKTPVENTNGYTSNGNASCILELNQWNDCTWNVATGPDVEWVRFRIYSSPTNYTSDNIYRNIEFEIND